MEIKICHSCGFETQDADFCPKCGTCLNEEPILDNQIDANEDLQETPQADKKVKIITASVALVLVLALGFFGWYFFAGKANTTKDLKFEELKGSFITQDNASYVDFEIEEITVEVTDNEAMSDASASSDAVKTTPVTFDGTYKTGYTTQYVQSVLAREYVNRNSLEEEYKQYARETGLVLDDYEGFVKSKGVSQGKLDEIDKELQLSSQRMQYDQEGYWDYEEQTKTIMLYGPDGVSEVASLLVKGDAIVDPVGFLEGEFKGGSRFNSTFKYLEQGITETVTFYEDGNYIIKAEYDGQDAQYVAGTYKADDNFVVMEINGQKAAHAKVNGGIASVVYKKQIQ